jgi:hypothetical protein
MRKTKEALLTLFEAVTVVGALLLLPCVLAGLAFGCELTEPLVQVLLVAATSTARSRPSCCPTCRRISTTSPRCGERAAGALRALLDRSRLLLDRFTLAALLAHRHRAVAVVARIVQEHGAQRHDGNQQRRADHEADASRIARLARRGIAGRALPLRFSFHVAALFCPGIDCHGALPASPPKQ